MNGKFGKTILTIDKFNNIKSIKIKLIILTTVIL